MARSVLHPFHLIRRHLPAQYTLPVAILLGLSFSCLFALLFHLTDVQDRMEQEREVEIVESAAETATQMVVHDLRDYAMWDDAVRHLVLRFDSRWANDNLGPYLGKTQGYDYVVVVDETNRPIYSYYGDKRQTGLQSLSNFGPSFSASLAAVHDPKGAPMIAGFSRSGNNIYIYSVAAVIPLTNKVTIPDGPRRVMFLASKVDRNFLDHLANVHGSPRLYVTNSKPAQDWMAIAIPDPHGRQIGQFTWIPRQPGSLLRQEIMPAFFAVTLLSLLAAGIILKRGRLAMEALLSSEARARHVANHDILTGFANRRALQDKLDGCLSDGRHVTILYLDLDGFKETNDLYGHGAGDELLRAAAARLRDECVKVDQIARVGGDEFAILLTDAPTDQAPALAQAILHAFQHPFSIAGYSISLGVSIGIAPSESCASAGEIIRRADVAMYAAKANGKNCVRIYDPVFDSGTELRKRLEHDLRVAIEQDRISVVFQPVVSAREYRVISVEALARWSHPVRGMVPPDQFIPIAEECGLIVALGRAVLTKACLEARDWNVDLAVNLSPAQFWDRDLTRAIQEVLNETGFPPRRLELEITESYLLRRPEAACEIIDQLRNMGIRIALDDFGTGFASIGYLQRLAFDSIKIDRSFVSHVTVDRKAMDMTRAIVAIGTVLNLPVTAEGIETREQADLMRVAGCSRLQGWLFGKPVSSDEFSALLVDDRLLEADM